MLRALRSSLRGVEEAAVDPVFLIDPDVLDSRSQVSSHGGFVKASFIAKNDEHCRFELHFGRERSQGRFNFFIGRGAEFYNYEELATDEDAEAIASDLLSFLRSTVDCEQVMARDEVVRARYRPSLVRLDGEVITLHWGGKPLLARTTTRTVVYQPWLGASAETRPR